MRASRRTDTVSFRRAQSRVVQGGLCRVLRARVLLLTHATHRLALSGLWYFLKHRVRF